MPPPSGWIPPRPAGSWTGSPTRVLLDNDATCGGFGEWWNRTDQPSMVYLSLNRGVGGAILVDGKLYDGVDHRAAEFGHICLHPADGPASAAARAVSKPTVHRPPVG